MTNKFEQSNSGEDKTNEQQPAHVDNMEIWETTKPMTMKEVLEEMKKRGLRALTVEEVEALVKNSEESELPKGSEFMVKEKDKKGGE